MKNIYSSLAVTALSLSLATATFAGVPLGGLTVAISPDGKTLVAGGDTRTLLVIDPETLEVKNRVWIETTITELLFNKDGSTLLVGDSAERVLSYKTSDWSKKTVLEKRDRPTLSRAADLFAALEEDYTNGPSIYFHAVADNAVKGSMRFTKGERVVGLGMNAEGTRVGVMFAEKQNPAEKKLEYKDIPKELKEPQRSEFQQQNDGKTGRFVVAEVPSGKILTDQTIFYTTPSCDVVFSGEKAFLLGTSGPQATIAPDGKVELFILPHYGYATAASPSQKLIMAGGMGTFTFTALEKIEPVNGTASKLPGFPEYFKGFATNDEGPVYASTTGYRVMRIGRNGNTEKEAPVK